MSDEENTVSKPKQEPKKAERVAVAERTYTVSNRFNSPFELQVSNQRFFARLEPRGRQGDSVVVPEWVYKHPDFKAQEKYLIVKEN